MPPLFTKKTDEKQGSDDDPLNPANRSAEQLNNAERQSQSDINSAFEDIASHPDNADLRATTDNGAVNPPPDLDRLENSGQWKNNVINPAASGLKGKTVNQALKRVGPIGFIVAVLVGGGSIIGLIIPGFMVPHLMQTITGWNDSSSTAMERRFLKVFSQASGDSDPNCAPKKIKCKAGRISNSALRKLEKNGVRACFDGDCDTPRTKRTGYPDKNPSHYEFDFGDRKEKVAVDGMREFLTDRDNRAFATKIFGVRGAFNLRVQAYSGKYFAKKFWNPIGLKRDGGQANGDNRNNLSPSQRMSAAAKKLADRIPGVSELRNRATSASDKLKSRLDRAKKGGTAYLAAVAGCIGPKVPKYVASGIAAIQMAQVISAFQDTVASPGAKIQASGVDESSAITAADNEATAALLTEQTKSEDGKMQSALDSPLLLAAMGIGGGRPAVSEKFTPGYAFLTSDAVKKAAQAEVASEATCDIVLHPATMYTAAAADAAVTAVASATIIGGIIKVAASWAISAIVSKMVANIAGNYLEKAIVDLAENDAIPQARGRELGDVIGIGAMAFFSSGAMARHLPTLSTAQVAEYKAIRQENEQFYAQMAAETLSPFDISTKYTFMGSIVHNTMNTFAANGLLSGSVSSRLSGLANVTLAPFSTSASAANFDDQYCSYGSDFSATGQTTSEDDVPNAQDAAINAAGFPCTGITTMQANIDSALALDLMIGEGWVDPEVEIEDTDTITELLEKEVITKGNPLRDYAEQCSNPATGDYIFNASSCVTLSTSGQPAGAGRCIPADSEDGEDVCPPEGSEATVEGVEDPRSVEAMVSFLIDYQVLQAMNGNDEEDYSSGGSSSGGTPSASAEVAGDLADSSIECANGTEDIGTVKTEYVGVRVDPSDKNPTIRLCRLTSIGGFGNNASGNAEQKGAVVNAAVSGIYQTLGEAAKADNISLSASSSFRLRQSCTATGDGACADPGYSHHQVGAAVDISLSDGSSAGSADSCTGRQTSTDRIWQWLDKNAPKFSIKQYSKENWHWEYVPSGVNEPNKCPAGSVGT